jgi:hypothetical protein
VASIIVGPNVVVWCTLEKSLHIIRSLRGHFEGDEVCLNYILIRGAFIENDLFVDEEL